MMIFSNIGKMTRNPVPFEMGFKMRYKDLLFEQDVVTDILEQNGYFIYDDNRRAEKRYENNKYISPLYKEFVFDNLPIYEEIGRFLDFHDMAEQQIPIYIHPVNNTILPNDVYNIRLYFSLVHLLGILMPYFNRNWRDVYIQLGESWDTEDFDLETLMYDTDLLEEFSHRSPISYLTEQNGTTIVVMANNGHPGMFLSGLSIAQSVIARSVNRTMERIAAGEENTFDEVPFTFTNREINVVDMWDDYERAYDMRGISLYELVNNPLLMPYNQYKKIPGLDFRYDDISSVLLDVIREYARNTGTIKDRMSRLLWSYLRYANRDHIPENNKDALYQLDLDEFEWNNGPEVR